MRTCLCAITVCLLWSAPAPAAGEPARLEELADIATQAREVAQRWLNGPDEGEDPADWILRRPLDMEFESRMKRLWYNAGSVAALARVLQSPRDEPADLYLVNRMLRPLLDAKTDVIRQAMPQVRAMHSKFGRYARLPDNPQPGADAPAEKAKPTQQEQQARLQRLKDVAALQFRNEQVSRLKQLTFRLMVYADQAELDRELIGMIRTTESNGKWEYTAMLDAVRAEARRMKQQRATAFYRQLKTLWREMLQREKDQRVRTYEDPSSVKLAAEGTTSGGTHRDNAGNRILKVLNQLAVPAKLPALQNPQPRKSKPKPKVGGRR